MTATPENTPEIVRQVMARRKANGLHVRIRNRDGNDFNYYPATQAQKEDFLRRASKASTRN